MELLHSMAQEKFSAVAKRLKRTEPKRQSILEIQNSIGSA
jgi:hypothetical protein